MFSRQKASTTPTITFQNLIEMTPEYLEDLATQLAEEIIPNDDANALTAPQKLVNELAKRRPSQAITLQKSVSPAPTPDTLNTTTDTNLLAHAEKGTEHHQIYKAMISLSVEEKEQLIQKFGKALTKFATCNALLLYTEGSKLNLNKGLRNAYAVGRQLLNTTATTTERNMKVEFFTHILRELCNPEPFFMYKQEPQGTFLSAVYESRQYASSKINNSASYLAAIKKTSPWSQNTVNALSLFDPETLAHVEGAALTLSDTTSASALVGTQNMYPAADELSTAVKEMKIDVPSTSI